MVTKGFGTAGEKKEMSSLFRWSAHQRQQNPIIHLPLFNVNIYIYVYACFIQILQTHATPQLIHTLKAVLAIFCRKTKNGFSLQNGGQNYLMLNTFCINVVAKEGAFFSSTSQPNALLQ